MRLPDPNRLSEPLHLFLYHHDRDEFHCTDARSFSRRMYMARFEAVLQSVKSWRELLGKAPRDTKILDLGCAQGNFSLTLAERGFRVVAADLQLPFLRYMKLKYEYGDLFCVNASVEALPFRSAFEVILLGEVIEHVAHPETLLETVRALMARSGCLILTTPNGERLLTGMPTLSQIRDRSQLVMKQFQPDADGHLYLLTRQELETEAAKAGLKVIDHQYFATPWVSGRLKFRVLVRFLPSWFSLFLDKLFLRIPVFARLFAEGQLVIVQTTRNATPLRI